LESTVAPDLSKAWIAASVRPASRKISTLYSPSRGVQTRARCHSVAKAHRLIGKQNLAFAWVRRALEESARRKLRVEHHLVEARHPR